MIKWSIAAVIAVVAILAGAYPFFLQGGDPSPLLVCRAELADLRWQLEYYRGEQGTYPNTQQGLNTLVKMPSDLPSPNHWHQRLPVLPTDPWKHAYQYVFPGRRNTKGFDLYSLGPDGVESGDDIYTTEPADVSSKRE